MILSVAFSKQVKLIHLLICGYCVVSMQGSLIVKTSFRIKDRTQKEILIIHPNNMPILRSVMTNLIKQYGAEKAKRVYYALERSGKLNKAEKTAHLRSKQGKDEYLKK